MRSKSISLLVCSMLAVATTCGAAYGDEFLKGNVTDLSGAESGGVPMVAPVLAPETGQTGSTNGNPLSGNAQQNNLNGNANDNGGDLHSLQASAGHNPVLSGQANDFDPDAQDQQLQIDWDNWRNRFIFAVQDNLTQEMNNNPESLIYNAARNEMVQRWPLGTMAWFYCSITPDRRIVNPRIVHSSGYPDYDQDVLQAVEQLNGNPILSYPPRSKRGIVTQVAGIKTATSTVHRYMHFNDIEHRTIP